MTRPWPLALLLTACTTFTGTIPAETSGSDGGGGFGGGGGKPADGATAEPLKCTAAVCWTSASAPDAPAVLAPACNPAGVQPGCPDGWTCTTTTAKVLAQGDLPAHEAAECVPGAPAQKVTLDTAPRPTAMVNGVDVALTITVNGAAPGPATKRPGTLRLTHRDDGATVWMALPSSGPVTVSGSLRPGRFDARLDLGDRGATAPPLPVFGVLDVTSGGEATVDVAAPLNQLTVLLDGIDVSEAEPGGSRGELVIVDAADQEARVPLPTTGPTTAAVALPEGTYRLSWDASGATALFVPRQHVLLQEGALDGSPQTFELETVSLFVAPTIDGAPPPAASSVVLDTGLLPPRTVSVKDGAVATTAFVTPTDLALVVPPSSQTAPPGTVRLAQGHVPKDQETVAAALQTVTLSGTVTVNGGPMAPQSVGTAARVELRAAPGLTPCAVSIAVQDGSFSGKVYAAEADAWYVPSSPPSVERPLQEQRLASAVDPGDGTTFNVQVASVSVQVLAGGATPADAAPGAVRGAVKLAPSDPEAGLGTLSAPLPTEGVASVTIPVTPGTYDVLVELLPGDPAWPSQPAVALPARTITGAESLIVDVAAAPLTLELTLGGAPPPAQPTAGGRGSIRLVSSRGESVDTPLAPAGPAAVTLPLWAGTWSAYYLCNEPCKSPLAPVWPTPLAEGLRVSP